MKRLTAMLAIVLAMLFIWPPAYADVSAPGYDSITTALAAIDLGNDIKPTSLAPERLPSVATGGQVAVTTMITVGPGTYANKHCGKCHGSGSTGFWSAHAPRSGYG